MCLQMPILPTAEGEGGGGRCVYKCRFCLLQRGGYMCLQVPILPTAKGGGVDVPTSADSAYCIGEALHGGFMEQGE